MHPNGQIPAYEWNFSDVNPPVHAWAALYVYEREAEIRGEGDREFLERVFHRLLANFTWWVNRKDPDGRNLFQGGFLGLDNIGVFDRSAPLPGGGTLEQADGTAWMALYCQWMLQIAVELAKHDPAYIDMAIKFIAHFVWIAVAMNPPEGDAELWDEEDGFYYDVMRMPDGSTIQLKVRSLVGLLPMCAATVFDGEMVDALPVGGGADRAFIERFSEHLVAALAHAPGPQPRGAADPGARQRGAAAADPRGDARRGRVPRPARDPRDLPAAPRAALSCSTGAARSTTSTICPAESDTGMFGGNSNWRGPVWFPMNLVILRGLIQLHRYYGDALKVECPTGSGRELNLLEVAIEIGRRLATTFTEDENGRRPVFGGIEKFQTDPHWHDLHAVPRVLPRRQRRRHRREPPDRLDRNGGAVIRARRDVQGAVRRDRRRCRLICPRLACLTVLPPARSHPGVRPLWPGSRGVLELGSGGQRPVSAVILPDLTAAASSW